MDTSLILKNFDNGTITKDATIDLLLQHTPRAYAIGAYLEARIQRDEYRDQLHAEQDETTRPRMRQGDVIDLIDHALDTDHIDDLRAAGLLVATGMEATQATHHVDTILAIKDRDLERVVYLDHPETAPRYCTRCGRKVTAAELSRRGICVECSTAAVKENLIALDTKTGPAYTHWRNAVLVWAYTLEDQETAEKRVTHAGTLGDYIATEVDTDLLYGVDGHESPEDLIDHDKYPGCDAECDTCPDTECPFRDTLADTELRTNLQ